MFKSTEVMPEGTKKKFFQKLSTRERKKIESYEETECHKRFEYWKERADQCRKRNQHNTVATLPCETREGNILWGSKYKLGTLNPIPIPNVLRFCFQMVRTWNGGFHRLLVKLMAYFDK